MRAVTALYKNYQGGNKISQILDAALEYEKAGLSVIPINPSNKKPLINWNAGNGANGTDFAQTRNHDQFLFDFQRVHLVPFSLLTVSLSKIIIKKGHLRPQFRQRLLLGAVGIVGSPVLLHWGTELKCAALGQT